MVLSIDEIAHSLALIPTDARVVIIAIMENLFSQIPEKFFPGEFLVFWTNFKGKCFCCF